MDTKIQTYAKRCEIAAWFLVTFGIIDWVLKWFIDWIIYFRSAFSFGNFMNFIAYTNYTKYTSLAEAMEKLPPEQWLNNLNFIDMIMKADVGASWIGLATLAKLSWASRLLGFLCDGIGVGIMVVGFWFFIKLMKQLKKGSMFSVEVIELLNKIAKVIFWVALYVPVNRTIISVLIAFNQPVGQRYWLAALNFGDILTLAASWFFVILTSLMRESRELQSDRDLTV